MFNRQIRMYALQQFPFRGNPVQVDEELEPDTKEQAKLLETIGYASFKKPAGYRNRSIRPARAAVMTTEREAPRQPEPLATTPQTPVEPDA